MCRQPLLAWLDLRAETVHDEQADAAPSVAGARILGDVILLQAFSASNEAADVAEASPRLRVSEAHVPALNSCWSG